MSPASGAAEACRGLAQGTQRKYRLGDDGVLADGHLLKLKRRPRAIASVRPGEERSDEDVSRLTPRLKTSANLNGWKAR